MRKHELLTAAYDAGAAIAKYRICKFGAADGKVIQALNDQDKTIGVSTIVAAKAGERVEVVRAGITPVEYGAAVARGDLLAADANGKAIPTVTQTKTYVGRAEVSGVAGDIGSVMVHPGII